MKKQKKGNVALIARFKERKEAKKAVAILQRHKIRAAIDGKAFGHPGIGIDSGFPFFVWQKDSSKAFDLIEKARKITIKEGPLKPAFEEGTLGFLDMLIYDCRKYLKLATGELKSMEEEGDLILDDPTHDFEKITIRLKRLKDQCMRLAGKKPLNWQR